MARATIERFNRTTGDSLGSVDAKLMRCDSEYAPFGGCMSATLEFIAPWGEEFITDKNEELVISKDGLPVFAGPVVSVEPTLNNSVQTVALDGWFRRFDEIEIVAPPADRITFGVAGGDYPAATRAFDVVQWVVAKIVADPNSPLVAGTITAPEFSAKLGQGGFAIYANDNLTKVMETLAMMDDYIYGVDSQRQIYFIPRTVVEADTLLTVQVAEDAPAGWKNMPRGMATGGRFIEDRRGPNYISVQSRDINAVPGTRMYKLDGTVQDGTRRRLNWYSPNVRHGYAARRLARGLFRRFTDYGLKVEDLSFFAGTQRLEPHLGAVAVTNFGTEVARKIAGSISVSWLDVIRGTVTLGENKPQAGSGNPATDPDAQPDDSYLDSPQIDTGDSSLIDFYDGYDGDGDELHEDGTETLDYGEDTVDETNGQSGGVGSSIRLGIITAESHPTYSVDVFKADDGGTVEANYTNVPMDPPGPAYLVLGQRVLVSFLTPGSPIILGLVPARGNFVKITGQKPANKYNLDLLSPADGTTVIASFEDCEAWPRAAYFSVGQETFGYWFNDADRPTPVGTGGCCNDNYYFVGQVIKD